MKVQLIMVKIELPQSITTLKTLKTLVVFLKEARFGLIPHT